MSIDRRTFLQQSSLALSAGALAFGTTALADEVRSMTQTKAAPPDLRLHASYWTIAGEAFPHTDREYSSFDFRARVGSIARQGFKGMGIWHSDLSHVLETYSLKDMKQILADNGIDYIELEFLADWFMSGEKKKASDARKRLLFEAAEVLGANHIKVGDFESNQIPMPDLIESFAALCREAADHGTRIGFELMPFAMITSLEDSRTMIEGAGEPNGGLIWDLWHVVKLGIPYQEAARFPLERVVHIEINDGYLERPAGMDFVTETTQHRKFCGEGQFDVQGFVNAMLAAGYKGPWGIEVLSQEHRSWQLEDLTRHAYTTTRAMFGA